LADSLQKQSRSRKGIKNGERRTRKTRLNPPPRQNKDNQYKMGIRVLGDMHPKKWTTIEMNLETRNQNAGQITE
jgi:hypothetical protein